MADALRCDWGTDASIMGKVFVCGGGRGERRHFMACYEPHFRCQMSHALDVVLRLQR